MANTGPDHVHFAGVGRRRDSHRKRTSRQILVIELDLQQVLAQLPWPYLEHVGAVLLIHKLTVGYLGRARAVGG